TLLTLPMLWFSQSAFSDESFDLLHSVPLEISGYVVAKDFPITFYTSDQVLKAIDSSPVLIIHMDALRRSNEDLPSTEQQKLIAALIKRQQLKEKDAQLAFDLGYAQLIYNNNKTGLFYLRKANDQFQNQFSSLAYAMAEVEPDLNHEGAPPDGMTTRKMDAM